MDSAKHVATSPSSSNRVLELKKTPRELIACSVKSRSKEAMDAGSYTRVKLLPNKQSTFPPPVVHPDPNTHERVKKLHDRSKCVKSKLMKIKHTMESQPVTSPPKQVQKKDVTEEDILREISRLQELVEKMRLKTTAPKERQNSRNSSESGNHVEVGEESNAPNVESNLNEIQTRKRRKIRPKNKRKAADDHHVQNMYKKYINGLISGSDPKLADLCYEVGDDLEDFAQRCVDAGLGYIIEGEVRVNAKNNHQAFVTLPNGSNATIPSLSARKYAMEGDVVRVFVRKRRDIVKPTVDDVNAALEAIKMNETKLAESEEMVISDELSSAFVIRLVNEIGNRVFVGSITLKNPDKLSDGDFFKFKPHDMKVPMIYIPVASCEDLLAKQSSNEILGLIYLAQITEITNSGRCIGRLQAPVGRVGNLADEIKAILMHNGLNDVQPFEERFEQMWTEPLAVTDDDLEGREDLRKECIFTIDPLTARDLDDAVSCKLLKDGTYEIGVHISDVTRFLEETSELDELVKLRATSIYLVNEVIHMLPKSLCFKCSLLPNEDKFAFSVFWQMNEKAEVVSTRFARSVIRSCTQLAYEHTQKIIDNPHEEFTVDDFPTIYNGFTVPDIVERVLKLNSLAEIMRKKRFENGSLSIDKPEFYFQFDPNTGEPISYKLGNRQTANFLIEEFMLLANQSVAAFIYQHFPDLSFLRSHQPPKPRAIKMLKAKLAAVGVDLDMSSSKTIFDGLRRICGASTSPEVVSVGLNYLLTKPMMRAKYFCSENVDTDADLHHYGLGIPIYTHFTSPIRRYPDIIVHRLLSAALNYTSPPRRTPDELHVLAKICNDQKFNAKNAGEESVNLYFKRYVQAKKSIQLRAVVTDLHRNSLEVIILETGHLISIQFKFQKVVVDVSKAPTVILISEKNSTKPPVELRMFSELEVKLMIYDGTLAGFFVSPDLEQRVQNEIIASKARKLEGSSDEVIAKTTKRQRKRAARKARNQANK